MAVTTRAITQVQPDSNASVDVANTIPETATMEQDAQAEQAGFHEKNNISNAMEIDYSDDDEFVASLLNSQDVDHSTVADDATQYGAQEGNFQMGEADMLQLDRAMDFRMRLQAVAERKELLFLALALERAEDEERRGFPEQEPLPIEAERVDILRSISN